jgi:hypothetical protein
MRITLNRVGFVDACFIRTTGPVGERFIVETKKSKVAGSFAAARGA